MIPSLKRLVLGSLLAALTACSPRPATEVMVVVTSDLSSTQLQGMRITVTRASDKTSLFDNCSCVGDRAGCASLPVKLGLVGHSDSSNPFVVTVAGFSDPGCSTLVVAQTATLQFFPGRTVELDMSLSAICQNKVCVPGNTCFDDGMCKSDLRSSLPTFNPNSTPDGGSPGATPAARQWAAMAYDPGRKRTVLYGGQGATNNDLDDTWEWDGQRWTQSQSQSPGPRFWPAMAYDPSKQRMLVYGGKYLTDTFVYDGQWKQLENGSGPGALHPTMVWDSQRSKMLLFDENFHMYELTSGDTWQARAAPATIPTDRSNSGVVYVASRGEMLLFGGHGNGTILNDFWSWNDVTWTPLSAVGPQRQEGAMMVDHVGLSTVILFGQYGTWEWNGTDWKEDRINAPPSRWSGMSAYDSDRSVMMIFGGEDGVSNFGDTWEFGTDRIWRQR